MPIYDHLCDHCGHAFSVVRSFSDPPVEHCPVCGKRPRRLIALPAIVFKGSGWYKTDSRASSPAAKESAAKDAPAKGTASTGGSTDGSGSSGATSDTSSEKKAPATSGEKGSAPAGGG